MTVSGLGSARTPHPPVTPPARTPRPEKPAGRDPFDQLTGADRELIFQVTGQRIGPGFDPGRETPTAFAAALAAERAGGRLAPGQPITGVYLKDLHHRYERVAAPNPVSPYLDKALAYLNATGNRRIDVSA